MTRRLLLARRQGRDRLATPCPLSDHDGEPVATGGSGTDVTELHAAREELRVLATTDSLTGLANRTALATTLADLLALPMRGTKALVLVDLDRLKAVNDTLGHAAGDAVVVEAARRLRTVTDGLPGSLAVRLGGDEFVLLLSGTSPATVLRAAQRALDVLALPCTGLSDHGQSVSMSGSAGLTWIGAQHTTMSTPLHEADLALRRSQALGRGVLTVYGEELQQRAAAQLDEEQQVREALRDDRLRVHITPVVDLTSGCVVGIEAHPRLVRRDGSHHLPDGFLPAARRLRVLTQIDRQVLRTVTGWLSAPDLAPWPVGTVADVLVPLSELTVQCPGFIDALRALMRGVPTDAPTLTLLLPEGTIPTDETLRPLLRELEQAGVGAGLDGFGAGRSSLGQLRDLPFDLVRLSPTVTSQLALGGAAGRVAEAVLALAGSLRLQVVASGVETARQRNLLAARDVTAGQGSLFDETLLGATVPAPREQTVEPARHLL